MSLAMKEALGQKLARAKELNESAATRVFTEDEQREYDGLIVEIRNLRGRLDNADDLAPIAIEEKREEAKADEDLVAVAKPTAPQISVREKPVYTKESRSGSWMQDLALLRDSDAKTVDVEGARDRLKRHYLSEGKEAEVRVLTAGTDSQGGYLVAPAHLQAEFIEMLAAGRPTADLASKLPLPPKTDSIKLPSQDGATAVAVHTENNALTETSATFNTVDATVVRVGGQQKIPNFLLDRSLPGVDQIILRDLAKRVAVKIDTDVLNGTTPEGILNADSIGTATYTAGTGTMAGLWPIILNAITDVRSAHYKEPEAIVMHPRRWGWMLGQLDANYRPFVGAVMPQNAMASHEGGAGQGFGQPVRVAGQILGIPVVLDNNVPVTLGSGTDEDAIIVGVFSEAYLMEAAPKFAVSTEAEFGADQTVARVTVDYAFTAERYPGAFSVISGTGLNDTL